MFQDFFETSKSEDEDDSFPSPPLYHDPEFYNSETYTTTTATTTTTSTSDKSISFESKKNLPLIKLYKYNSSLNSEKNMSITNSLNNSPYDIIFDTSRMHKNHPLDTVSNSDMAELVLDTVIEPKKQKKEIFTLLNNSNIDNKQYSCSGYEETINYVGPFKIRTLINIKKCK